MKIFDLSKTVVLESWFSHTYNGITYRGTSKHEISVWFPAAYQMFSGGRNNMFQRLYHKK